MPTASPLALATGRRKSSIARVRVHTGSGKIAINGRPLETYLPTEDLQNHALESIRSVSKQKDYDIEILADGGGLNSQAGAIRHAISRALIEIDLNLRAPLKKAGFLTRDPRMKERKKSGQPGARRRFQFSKR
jgi:small subunit ribosomal protein S9